MLTQPAVWLLSQTLVNSSFVLLESVPLGELHASQASARAFSDGLLDQLLKPLNSKVVNQGGPAAPSASKWKGSAVATETKELVHPVSTVVISPHLFIKPAVFVAIISAPRRHRVLLSAIALLQLWCAQLLQFEGLLDYTARQLEAVRFCGDTLEQPKPMGSAGGKYAKLFVSRHSSTAALGMSKTPPMDAAWPWAWLRLQSRALLTHAACPAAGRTSRPGTSRQLPTPCTASC